MEIRVHWSLNIWFVYLCKACDAKQLKNWLMVIWWSLIFNIDCVNVIVWLLNNLVKLWDNCVGFNPNIFYLEYQSNLTVKSIILWCLNALVSFQNQPNLMLPFTTQLFTSNGTVDGTWKLWIILQYYSHLPSSPLVQDKLHWGRTEKWLEQRYAEIFPGLKHKGELRVIGYEWRTLHFNDYTRESTVKIMAAYKEEEPGSLCFMQQAHCLAVPCNSIKLFSFAVPIQKFACRKLKFVLACYCFLVIVMIL